MPQFLPPDEWRRVDALFLEALDWPVEEREERLRETCGDDQPLFEAVRRLLRASTDAERFLETPPPMPRGALEDLEGLAGHGNGVEGEQVAGYKLLRPIGRGGMASVWLAERVDGLLNRQVALKMLRPGLDTRDVLARFAFERRILSSLEHPNIARLYDGGSTDDGLPFLAMEYVEGRPIDEFCDEERYTVEDRLRLFLEVGRVVQFAHGRLVIHRDIKPSNILVGRDGAPKLLDFGIAKLLDPTEEMSHHTRTGLRPLTLRYASPEQVRGAEVTTASDVYQLGILLYGLLTGRPPYEPDDGSRLALEEAILETSPTAPSKAARGMSPEDARCRRSTPRKLSRRLSGDLDTIVLKALEKRPEARYSTAVEMVEDLRSHLEGRPIVARRAGFAYRTRKYFQRHPWAAPALGAAALVLAGYVVTVERHGRQLERERNVAQAEASRATAVRDFLTEIFEMARPGEGADMSVRELVDGAADRIGADLGSHPAVLAELSNTLGSIYLALGLRVEAQEHLSRAVGLLEGEPPGAVRNQQLAVALEGLADALQGTDVDSAANLRTRAYRLATGIQPPTFDAARVILESAHNALPGDPDSAHSARLHAVEVLRRDPDRREELAAALQELAYDGENVLQLHEEALRIRRELLGDYHPAVAASLNDLALHYDDREQGSGDSLILRAIEIDREVLGPAHATTLALINNYAYMLGERGDHEGAVRMFRGVLAERERAYPNERWHLAYPLHGLGKNLMELGRYDEAEEALRETVRVLVEHGSAEGRLVHLTSVARTSLARCLLAQGKLDESERVARRALADVSSNPSLETVARDVRAHLDAVAEARAEDGEG